MVRVMFVCLGNICRSPAAEGIFRNYVEAAGLSSQIQIASSGTGSSHVGHLPDPRMREHASRRGYQLTSKAQQFKPEFFNNFDYLITMDRSNYNNVVKQAQNLEQKSKVVPFSHYCIENSINEIPDPYLDGAEGFELVLDLLEDGCNGLLDRIRSQHGF